MWAGPCLFVYSVKYQSVQSLSRVQLCNPMDCSMPGFPVHQTPGAYSNLSPSCQWCHSTISSPVVPFSSYPQSFPTSLFFSNESVLHIRWTKYCSFSFSISLSNEYSGLNSFSIDWMDLFAIQRMLKSLLQHHTSKVSILQCSAFLIVQLSHPYCTTGKTVALTRQTFVGKVMSLFFSMLLCWL